MQALSDLNQLSHAEKDELIRLLWSMVQGQAKQLAALQGQVAELPIQAQQEQPQLQQTALQRWTAQARTQVLARGGRATKRRPAGSSRHHPEPGCPARPHFRV